jgi:tetratricopeptide (TPR) repeat protein
MSRGAQLAVVASLAFGSAVSGAVAGYFAILGDPSAGPLFVVAAVLGLLALACLTEWGRRAFLPTIGLLLLAAALWKQILTPGDIVRMLAIPALAIALIFGMFVASYAFQRRRHRVANHALALIKAGDAAGAMTFLEEELRANGLPERGWNALSLAYRNLGKWAEALKAMEEAIARGGPRPLYLNNKAVLLLKSGQAAAALPLIEEASRRQPYDWLNACNLGVVRAELGQREEAVAALRRAERLSASPPLVGAARESQLRNLEMLQRKIAELPAAGRPEDEEVSDPEPVVEYRGPLDLARLNLAGWLLIALAIVVLGGSYIVLAAVLPLGRAPLLPEPWRSIVGLTPFVVCFGFFQLTRLVLRRYGISIYRR